MKNEEYHIQKQVVQWLQMQYPKALFTISPSGNKLPLGVARRFKFMGYRAGSPDLAVYQPAHGYHGLFIEFKTPKGYVTKPQKEFISALRDRGYLVAIIRSFDEARNFLNKYFNPKSINICKGLEGV